MTDIRVGQIWKDVDPRADRHVRVLGISTDGRTISIQTVIPNGKLWPTAKGSRATHANRSRFNGRRGGYALQEDYAP